VVTEFYHTDHHGSVVTMSGATGDPVMGEGANEYDPFGRANISARARDPRKYSIKCRRSAMYSS
jgi:hypothetical protein